MGSLLGYRAASDDQYLVRVAYGVEPVGNDEQGLTTAEFAYRRLDIALVVRVHAGGRLVQDDDGRILEDAAGNGDALFFAAGKSRAPLSGICFGHNKKLLRRAAPRTARWALLQSNLLSRIFIMHKPDLQNIPRSQNREHLYVGLAD